MSWLRSNSPISNDANGVTGGQTVQLYAHTLTKKNTHTQNSRIKIFIKLFQSAMTHWLMQGLVIALQLNGRSSQYLQHIATCKISQPFLLYRLRKIHKKTINNFTKNGNVEKHTTTRNCSEWMHSACIHHGRVYSNRMMKTTRVNWRERFR